MWLPFASGGHSLYRIGILNMPVKQFVPLYSDPFSPVLTSSQALRLSEEQRALIQKVLMRSCSDSRFADKAYVAIARILTAGSTPAPTVTSLNPPTVAIGSPTFDIEVHGTGFTPESKIIFNGFEEPTTYVSANIVKTGVNMPLWLAPVVVPVGVASKEGLLSNTMNFSFTEVEAPAALSAKKFEKKEEKILDSGHVLEVQKEDKK